MDRSGSVDRRGAGRAAAIRVFPGMVAGSDLLRAEFAVVVAKDTQWSPLAGKDQLGKAIAI